MTPTNRLVSYGRRSNAYYVDLSAPSLKLVKADDGTATENLIAPQAALITKVIDKREAVCDEIKGYQNLELGWNGADSHGPSQESMSRAIKFVKAMPPGLPLPTPMLSPQSAVELYWDTSMAYVDVSFEEGGRLSLYARSRDDNAETFIDGVDEAGIDTRWYFNSLSILLAQEQAAA